MTAEPKRIQRKRTKGWRMPENAVYVGRPTKWGNPFRVGQPRRVVGGKVFQPGISSRAEAVAWFRTLKFPASVGPQIKELRGKDLACWCPLVDQNGDKVPCHADVLLEWANR